MFHQQISINNKNKLNIKYLILKVYYNYKIYIYNLKYFFKMYNSRIILPKKSDRFISSRSSERDRKLDKYKINDENRYLNNKNISLKIKSKIVNRTPSIVYDENVYSQKIYLDLLKTQIFENNDNNKNNFNSI